MLAACGEPSLVDLTALPPGDACPEGGVLVEHGSDDNGDGTLQDDEVDSTETLCNGTDTAPALVDTMAEPPGTNCANGGTRIRTGIDVDRDGMLGDGEVQREAFICNSAPGAATLVVVESEPPGTNCMLGGVSVRSGDDVDHDGTLDASEVTSTSYVCTGQVPVDDVVAGNFYLYDSLSQAMLVGVRRIAGNLLVVPRASLPHPVAPMLEQVGGLWFAYQAEPAPASLTTADLPVLTTVENGIVIDAPALHTVNLPVLATTAGLSIRSAGALRVLRLPALAQTDAFVIQSAPVLESLDLPALAQIVPTTTGISVTAPRLPACQVTELVTQTGYAGPVALSAPPCELVDRCRLAAPQTSSTTIGAPIDIVGRVRILGRTDASAGTDPSVVLRAQIGAGPRGETPTASTWTWADAAATPAWNDATAVGFDEYRAPVTFSSSGSFDVAARFSGDGGRTWTYCDRSVAGSDGSEDGYQVANAGHVEVP